MALYDSVVGFVSSTLSAFLTNVVVATIILLFGFIIGRILGNLAKRILSEIGANKFFYAAFRLNFSVEDTVSVLLSYFIYFMTIVLALNQVGVSELIFNIIAFTVAFFILLSMFLTLKDFLPNLFAGITIAKKGILKKGDLVSINGIHGKVIEVNFYSIKLESGKKEIIFIPNSTALKSTVVHEK